MENKFKREISKKEISGVDKDKLYQQLKTEHKEVNKMQNNLKQKVKMNHHLFERFKSNMKKMALYSSAATIALVGVVGCGTGYDYVYNQGLYKKVVRFLVPDDYVLVCPTPAEPFIDQREDPVPMAIALSRYEFYFNQVRYHVECIKEATGYDIPIPEFKYSYDKLKLMGEQLDYLKKKIDDEDAKKQIERLEGIIKEITDGEGLVTIHNTNENTNSPTSNSSPVQSTSPLSPGYIHDFNKQMQEKYKQNPRLSLEEQAKICAGNLSNRAEHVGTVNFADCKSNAARAEGTDNLIGKLKSSVKDGDIILYCGHASEPPASNCPTKSDEFGNNLQLSWDRGENFAKYSLDKLDENTKITQAVYASGALFNRRSVDVYIVN